MQRRRVLGGSQVRPVGARNSESDLVGPGRHGSQPDCPVGDHVVANLIGGGVVQGDYSGLDQGRVDLALADRSYEG